MPKMYSVAYSDCCDAGQQTSLRNDAGISSLAKLLFLFSEAVQKCIARQRNLTGSVFLLTLPGIFNLIEQALGSLSAH